MSRSDVCTISMAFLAVAASFLLPSSAQWICLIGGLGEMVLYICMGRFRITIHYAGWGRGPDAPFLHTVTEAMQAYVDSKRKDVKDGMNSVVAGAAGFEPATLGLEGRCSIP